MKSKPIRILRISVVFVLIIGIGIMMQCISSKCNLPKLLYIKIDDGISLQFELFSVSCTIVAIVTALLSIMIELNKNTTFGIELSYIIKNAKFINVFEIMLCTIALLPCQYMALSQNCMSFVVYLFFVIIGLTIFSCYQAIHFSYNESAIKKSVKNIVKTIVKSDENFASWSESALNEINSAKSHNTIIEFHEHLLDILKTDCNEESCSNRIIQVYATSLQIVQKNDMFQISMLGDIANFINLNDLIAPVECFNNFFRDHFFKASKAQSKKEIYDMNVSTVIYCIFKMQSELYKTYLSYFFDCLIENHYFSEDEKSDLILHEIDMLSSLNYSTDKDKLFMLILYSLKSIIDKQKNDIFQKYYTKISLTYLHHSSFEKMKIFLEIYLFYLIEFEEIKTIELKLISDIVIDNKIDIDYVWEYYDFVCTEIENWERLLIGIAKFVELPSIINDYFICISIFDLKIPADDLFNVRPAKNVRDYLIQAFNGKSISETVLSRLKNICCFFKWNFDIEVLNEYGKEALKWLGKFEAEELRNELNNINFSENGIELENRLSDHLNKMQVIKLLFQNEKYDEANFNKIPFERKLEYNPPTSMIVNNQLFDYIVGQLQHFIKVLLKETLNSVDNSHVKTLSQIAKQRI